MHKEDVIHWIPGLIGAGLGAGLGSSNGVTTAVIGSVGLGLAGLFGGKWALEQVG